MGTQVSNIHSQQGLCVWGLGDSFLCSAWSPKSFGPYLSSHCWHTAPFPPITSTALPSPLFSFHSELPIWFLFLGLSSSLQQLMVVCRVLKEHFLNFHQVCDMNPASFLNFSLVLGGEEWSDISKGSKSWHGEERLAEIVCALCGTQGYIFCLFR